jgi:hypothetical protein
MFERLDHETMITQEPCCPQPYQSRGISPGILIKPAPPEQDSGGELRSPLVRVRGLALHPNFASNQIFICDFYNFFSDLTASAFGSRCMIQAFFARANLAAYSSELNLELNFFSVKLTGSALRFRNPQGCGFACGFASAVRRGKESVRFHASENPTIWRRVTQPAGTNYEA